MAESSPVAGSSARPSSSYAAELALGAGSRAFSGPLEAEYTRQYLLENRTLIRAASLLALLLGVPRGIEQILLGVWSDAQLIKFAVVLASSFVLAGLAWSPWYQRLYLPVAQVLVPLRGSLVAIIVAGVAAEGQLESLMLLPLLVIGPFFVLGLRFRAGLVAVTAAIAAYVVSSAIVGLEWPLVLRSCSLLLAVAGACGVVARTLERTSRMRFLESHAMAELAQHDALTGLKNRRVFDEHLERSWAQAIEQSRVVAILLIDVDHFKAYNDRYGHQAGDRALHRVAQMLQRCVARPQDVLARYGGEEFAGLLYDVNVAEAQQVAERMRKAIGGLALEHRGAGAGVVTISVGVAVVEPSPERRARGAVQLADEALYLAKTRGRNRVELLDQGAHNVLETGVFAKSTALRG